MKITINQANFLIDLLDRHKETLYRYMRICKYPMNDILSFINGVTFVQDHCSRYVMDIVMYRGYNIIRNFEDIVFIDYDDINKTLEKILLYKDTIDQACKWEQIGIKYTVCLIKFYMEHVVFGTYDIVNSIYLPLPNKDDPDSYDWELHGWNF